MADNQEEHTTNVLGGMHLNLPQNALELILARSMKVANEGVFGNVGEINNIEQQVTQMALNPNIPLPEVQILNQELIRLKRAKIQSQLWTNRYNRILD